MNDSPNGAQPEPQPVMQTAIIAKTVIYDQFSYEIKDIPQLNRRDVIISSPAGERIVLPFHDVDAAIEFGNKMAAPSIAVPRPGEMPRL
jgi:hypothetical protein